MRDKVAIEVWDGWIRLFHWGLVAAVLISFYTTKTSGAPFLFPVEVHAQSGYSCSVGYGTPWVAYMQDLERFYIHPQKQSPTPSHFLSANPAFMPAIIRWAAGW